MKRFISAASCDLIVNFFWFPEEKKQIIVINVLTFNFSPIFQMYINMHYKYIIAFLWLAVRVTFGATFV